MIRLCLFAWLLYLFFSKDPAKPEQLKEVLKGYQTYVDHLKTTTGISALTVYDAFGLAETHIENTVREIRSNKNDPIYRKYGWDEVVAYIKQASQQFNDLNVETFDVILHEESSLNMNMEQLQGFMENVKKGRFSQCMQSIQRMIDKEKKVLMKYLELQRSYQSLNHSLGEIREKAIENQELILKEMKQITVFPMWFVMTMYILPPIGYGLHTMRNKALDETKGMESVSLSYSLVGEGLKLAEKEVHMRIEGLSRMRMVAEEIKERYEFIEHSLEGPLSQQDFREQLIYLEEDITGAIKLTHETLIKYNRLTNTPVKPLLLS